MDLLGDGLDARFDTKGDVRGFGAGGELDPMQNLGRYHYFKEMFLDSSTTVSLLTSLPNLPDDTNILPVAYAIETAGLANHLSQSQRCFIHAFAQPNRGYIAPHVTPIHQAEDFQWMRTRRRTSTSTAGSSTAAGATPRSVPRPRSAAPRR